MTKKQRREHEARRKVLSPCLTPVAAAVMAAVWPTSVVVAQEGGLAEDALPEQEEIEEIITTGSRISRDTYSSAAPMNVVLSEEAPVRGINDVATLLQTTTVAAGSPQVTAVSVRRRSRCVASARTGHSCS